jgi:hypothetical protein
MIQGKKAKGNQATVPNDLIIIIGEDYIDKYDEEKMRQQNKRFSETIKPPKWMLVAWDIYTLLYNHNKGLMFHEPVDTEALGCPDYYNVIKNPMDLETMKVYYFVYY